MIKGVVFDLDHTLYDRDASDRAAMGRFYDAFPERIVPGVSRERAQEAIVQAAHRHIYQGWSAIVESLRRERILTRAISQPATSWISSSASFSPTSCPFPL